MPPSRVADAERDPVRAGGAVPAAQLDPGRDRVRRVAVGPHVGADLAVGVARVAAVEGQRLARLEARAGRADGEARDRRLVRRRPGAVGAGERGSVGQAKRIRLPSPNRKSSSWPRSRRRRVRRAEAGLPRSVRTTRPRSSARSERRPAKAWQGRSPVGASRPNDATARSEAVFPRASWRAAATRTRMEVTVETSPATRKRTRRPARTTHRAGAGALGAQPGAPVAAARDELAGAATLAPDQQLGHRALERTAAGEALEVAPQTDVDGQPGGIGARGHRARCRARHAVAW